MCTTRYSIYLRIFLVILAGGFLLNSAPLSGCLNCYSLRSNITSACDKKPNNLITINRPLGVNCAAFALASYYGISPEAAAVILDNRSNIDNSFRQYETELRTLQRYTGLSLREFQVAEIEQLRGKNLLLVNDNHVVGYDAASAQVNDNAAVMELSDFLAKYNLGGKVIIGGLVNGEIGVPMTEDKASAIKLSWGTAAASKDFSAISGVINGAANSKNGSIVSGFKLPKQLSFNSAQASQDNKAFSVLPLLAQSNLSPVKQTFSLVPVRADAASSANNNGFQFLRQPADNNKMFINSQETTRPIQAGIVNLLSSDQDASESSKAQSSRQSLSGVDKMKPGKRAQAKVNRVVGEIQKPQAAPQDSETTQEANSKDVTEPGSKKEVVQPAVKDAQDAAEVPQPVAQNAPAKVEAAAPKKMAFTNWAVTNLPLEKIKSAIQSADKKKNIEYKDIQPLDCSGITVSKIAAIKNGSKEYDPAEDFGMYFSEGTLYVEDSLKEALKKDPCLDSVEKQQTAYYALIVSTVNPLDYNSDGSISFADREQTRKDYALAKDVDMKFSPYTGNYDLEISVDRDAVVTKAGDSVTVLVTVEGEDADMADIAAQDGDGKDISNLAVRGDGVYAFSYTPQQPGESYEINFIAKIGGVSKDVRVNILASEPENTPAASLTGRTKEQAGEYIKKANDEKRVNLLEIEPVELNGVKISKLAVINNGAAIYNPGTMLGVAYSPDNGKDTVYVDQSLLMAVDADKQLYTSTEKLSVLRTMIEGGLAQKDGQATFKDVQKTLEASAKEKGMKIDFSLYTGKDAFGYSLGTKKTEHLNVASVPPSVKIAGRNRAVTTIVLEDELKVAIAEFAVSQGIYKEVVKGKDDKLEFVADNEYYRLTEKDGVKEVETLIRMEGRTDFIPVASVVDEDEGLGNKEIKVAYYQTDKGSGQRVFKEVDGARFKEDGRTYRFDSTLGSMEPVVKIGSEDKWVVEDHVLVRSTASLFCDMMDVTEIDTGIYAPLTKQEDGSYEYAKGFYPNVALKYNEGKGSLVGVVKAGGQWYETDFSTAVSAPGWFEKEWKSEWREDKDVAPDWTTEGTLNTLETSDKQVLFGGDNLKSLAGKVRLYVADKAIEEISLTDEQALKAKSAEGYVAVGNSYGKLKVAPASAVWVPVKYSENGEDKYAWAGLETVDRLLGEKKSGATPSDQSEGKVEIRSPKMSDIESELTVAVDSTKQRDPYFELGAVSKEELYTPVEFTHKTAYKPTNNPKNVDLTETVIMRYSDVNDKDETYYPEQKVKLDGKEVYADADNFLGGAVWTPAWAGFIAKNYWKPVFSESKGYSSFRVDAWLLKHESEKKTPKLECAGGCGNCGGKGKGAGLGNANGKGDGNGDGLAKGNGDGDGTGKGKGEGEGKGNGKGEGEGQGKGEGKGQGKGKGDGQGNNPGNPGGTPGPGQNPGPGQKPGAGENQGNKPLGNFGDRLAKSRVHVRHVKAAEKPQFPSQPTVAPPVDENTPIPPVNNPPENKKPEEKSDPLKPVKDFVDWVKDTVSDVVDPINNAIDDLGPDPIDPNPDATQDYKPLPDPVKPSNNDKGAKQNWGDPENIEQDPEPVQDDQPVAKLEDKPFVNPSPSQPVEKPAPIENKPQEDKPVVDPAPVIAPVKDTNPVEKPENKPAVKPPPEPEPAPVIAPPEEVENEGTNDKDNGHFKVYPKGTDQPAVEHKGQTPGAFAAAGTKRLSLANSGSSTVTRDQAAENEIIVSPKVYTLKAQVESLQLQSEDGMQSIEGNSFDPEVSFGSRLMKATVHVKVLKDSVAEFNAESWDKIGSLTTFAQGVSEDVGLPAVENVSQKEDLFDTEAALKVIASEELTLTQNKPSEKKTASDFTMAIDKQIVEAKKGDTVTVTISLSGEDADIVELKAMDADKGTEFEAQPVKTSEGVYAFSYLVRNSEWKSIDFIASVGDNVFAQRVNIVVDYKETASGTDNGGVLQQPQEQVAKINDQVQDIQEKSTENSEQPRETAVSGYEADKVHVLLMVGDPILSKGYEWFDSSALIIYNILTDAGVPEENIEVLSNDAPSEIDTKYFYSHNIGYLGEPPPAIGPELTSALDPDTINKALDAAATSVKDDELYLAVYIGHGTPGWVIPYQLSPDTLSEKLGDIPAKNIIVLSAACFSGGIINELSANTELKDRIVILTASSTNQVSAGVSSPSNVDDSDPNNVELDVVLSNYENAVMESLYSENKFAESNGDDIVSFEEAHYETARNTQNIETSQIFDYDPTTGIYIIPTATNFFGSIQL